MKKNELFELTIEDMSKDGEGIGHLRDHEKDGLTVFVKDTAPGDRVLARMLKEKKSYAYGRLERIIEPSPDRVEPLCGKARSCGGCTLQHLSYEKQLELKQKYVENCLSRIGGLENAAALMEPIIGMDEPWHFRNKMQFPVGRDKAGAPVAGFYAGHSHSLIALSDCPAGHPVNKEIIRGFTEYMKEESVTEYDEETHSGLVRHLLIRTGFATGELMVCVIINGDKLPGQEVMVRKLRDAVERYNKEQASYIRLSTVSININKEKTNRILGFSGRTIYGEPVIVDTIRDLKFEIAPESFFQINPLQTERLYGKALEYAGLSGDETVWDMYCGIGTISLFLAGKAKQVYGVEIVPQAIENARRNAEINGFSNTEFFAGKAEEVVPKCYEEDPQKYTADVVVVDPPRKGCDRALLETIISMSPKRLVYVSCDPATLARDIAILNRGGFEVKRVTPTDMFPHSMHVETVVQLSKGDIDNGSSERSDAVKAGDFGMISGYSKGNKTPETTNVKIDFSLENLDLSELRGKATYEQIKDYVREQTGFRVSTLYISQVKKKCGLEVGESYNKPKSEDTKQPQCTPEKEEAIMQALRHYGVI